MIAAALQAPVSQLPTFVGVDLGAAGYAIAKINAVLPTEDKPKELSEMALIQYEQLHSQAEGAAYYEMLKKKFNVQFKISKP